MMMVPTRNSADSAGTVQVGSALLRGAKNPLVTVQTTRARPPYGGVNLICTVSLRSTPRLFENEPCRLKCRWKPWCAGWPRLRLGPRLTHEGFPGACTPHGSGEGSAPDGP